MNRDLDRPTTLLRSLLLAVFVVSALVTGPVSAQAGNNDNSIVGNWICESVRGDGSSFKVLHSFHFGGTSVGVAAAGGPELSAHGSWERQGNHYVHTFYILIAVQPDTTVGFVQGRAQMWLVGKDQIVGETDIFFLPGDDPFEAEVIEDSLDEQLTCYRLKATAP